MGGDTVAGGSLSTFLLAPFLPPATGCLACVSLCACSPPASPPPAPASCTWPPSFSFLDAPSLSLPFSFLAGASSFSFSFSFLGGASSRSFSFSFLAPGASPPLSFSFLPPLPPVVAGAGVAVDSGPSPPRPPIGAPPPALRPRDALRGSAPFLPSTSGAATGASAWSSRKSIHSALVLQWPHDSRRAATSCLMNLTGRWLSRSRSSGTSASAAPSTALSTHCPAAAPTPRTGAPNTAASTAVTTTAAHTAQPAILILDSCCSCTGVITVVEWSHSPPRLPAAFLYHDIDCAGLAAFIQAHTFCVRACVPGGGERRWT